MLEKEPALKVNLPQKIAFNAAAQFIGRGLGLLVSIVSVGFITRYLGVSGYGQYAAIFAYAAFFGTIADFGMSWIFVRELSLARHQDRGRLLSSYIWFRLLSALTVLLAGLLILPLFHYERIVWQGVILAMLSAFFGLINGAFVSVFQAELRMHIPVSTELIGRILALLGVIYVSAFNLGLLALVFASILAIAVNLALNIFLISKGVKVNLKPDFQLLKGLFRETAVMGLVVILGLVYFKIDLIMLSVMKPSFDLGIYGAGYKLFEVALAVPALFLGVVLPPLTRSLKESHSRTRTIIQHAFDALSFLAVLFFIIVLARSRELVLAIAGDEFVSRGSVSLFGQLVTSAVVLQILSFAGFVSYISHLFGTIVVAMRDQKILLFINLGAVLVNVGLNYLLIPSYSYLAAALVTVLTEIVAFVATVYVVSRRLAFLPRSNRLVVNLLAGVLGFLVMSANLPWLVALVLGLLVYLVVGLGLGGFDANVLRGALGRR